MKPYIDNALRGTTCWKVKITCTQEADDASETDLCHEFSVTMHQQPGGGWFYRLSGDASFNPNELQGLSKQLEEIAGVLRW